MTEQENPIKGILHKDNNTWIVMFFGGYDFLGAPVVGQNHLMLHDDDVETIHRHHVSNMEVNFKIVNVDGIRFAKLIEDKTNP